MRSALFFSILLGSSLLPRQDLQAAFEFKGHGSNYMAGGSGGIASADVSFTLFNNPAKLSLSKRAGIELFYRNYFGLSDWNQISLANQFRLYGIPLGLGISRYGNKIYSETEIRLGMAYHPGQNVHLGLTLNLYHLAIENYGNATGFGLDLAAYYELTPAVSMAFVVSNINEPRLGQSRERVPVLLAAGLSYKVLSEAQLSFDIVKEEQNPFDYRFGIRYYLKPWLSVISGFRDAVNTLSAGFSLGESDWQLGYAFLYHAALGGSHSLSVAYAF